MSDFEHADIPILCLGLPRTGSASLGKALQILGYPKVHHGTNMKAFDPQWPQLSLAADRTFKSLPTYDPERSPFTRSDWDAIISSKYDATTDIFSYFALSLLDAYPEARVILVERDIESWLQSWNLQKSVWFAFMPFWLLHLVQPMTGSIAFTTSKKIIMGWIGSNSRVDVFNKAREAYKRHYAELRKVLSEKAPESVLEYNLEDGWEPLCRFLEKDIPQEPFPRINQLAPHVENARKNRHKAGLQVLTSFVVMGLLGIVAARYLATYLK